MTTINKTLLAIATLTLVLCHRLPAAAQTDTLSLDQCHSMAIESNRELIAARHATTAARHTVRSSRGNFLPDIKAVGNGLYSSADGSVGLLGYNMEYEIGAVLSGGLSLSQPLYAGGKITAAYRLAQLSSDAAVTRERLTATDVIQQTDEAYVSLVKAQAMVSVAESNRALLCELMRSVESAFRHGMRPRNDVLKVQVKLNEAELLCCRADNAVRLASMSLCHCIGLPVDSPVAAAATLHDIVPDSCLSLPTATADVSLRPEHTLLEQQVEMARQQVRLTRSELLPQVGVQAGYGYLHGGRVNDRTLIDRSSFSAMLSVAVPLYHFGERRHKVGAARARLLQAQTEQQDMHERMVLELALAVTTLDEARRELTLARRALEQAEENRRVSRRQYDGGMESLADHLEAQTLWQQASAQHVEAQCDLYLAGIALLKARGTLY